MIVPSKNRDDDKTYANGHNNAKLLSNHTHSKTYVYENVHNNTMSTNKGGKKWSDIKDAILIFLNRFIDECNEVQGSDTGELIYSRHFGSNIYLYIGHCLKGRQTLPHDAETGGIVFGTRWKSYPTEIFLQQHCSFYVSLLLELDI